MSKRARVNIPDPKTQAGHYKICKKYGRSRGPLVMGLNGVMVTQKVLQAQKRNRKIED